MASNSIPKPITTHISILEYINMLQPIRLYIILYTCNLCLSVFMNEHYYYISYHLPCKRVPISLRRRRYCKWETIEKKPLVTYTKAFFCFQTTHHRGRLPNRVIESDFSGTTPTRGTTILYCSPDSLLLLLALVSLSIMCSVQL